MAFLSSVRSLFLSLVFWVIFWNLWNLKNALVADFTNSLDRPTIVTTSRSLSPPPPAFEIIFYFHRFIQVEQKRFMESWLHETNYRSVEVVSGDPSLECSTILCRQNLRLTRTYELLVKLHFDLVGDKSNGLPILVLHQNNLRLLDMSSLSRSITAFSKKNENWDVIRLNCVVSNQSELTLYESNETTNNSSSHCGSNMTNDSGFVWRNSETLTKAVHSSISSLCLLAPLRVYCLDGVQTETQITTQSESSRIATDKIPWVERVVVVSRDHRVKFMRELSKQEKRRDLTRKDLNDPHSMEINRIYYINLEKNGFRRRLMESWLEDVGNIPFQRIDAQRGMDEACVSNKRDKCKGIAGLGMTLLYTLDQLNHTGISLVFEDDFVLNHNGLDLINKALQLVPDDFDILRFDCWGTEDFRFSPGNGGGWLLNLNNVTHKKGGGGGAKSIPFYGGAHLMVWNGRNSTITKLRKTWSELPFDSVDSRLGNNRFGLKSYCVQIGVGMIYKITNESSDIQV